MNGAIAWGTLCLIGGTAQLVYGIRNGRIFYPWSRTRYTDETGVYWLSMAGSVGGIVFGIGALIFGLS